MIRPTIISGLALSLFPSFGCMRPTYSTDIVAEGDYGSPITQQDGQAKATTFLKIYLKDPISAQYEWMAGWPGGPSFAIAKGGVTMIGCRMRYQTRELHHSIGQHLSQSIGRTERSPNS